MKTLFVKLVTSQLHQLLRGFRPRLPVRRLSTRLKHHQQQQQRARLLHFLHGLTTARLIFTGFSGFSPSAGAWLIASATSIPFVTVPNAENLASRCEPRPTRMKK